MKKLICICLLLNLFGCGNETQKTKTKKEIKNGATHYIEDSIGLVADDSEIYNNESLNKDLNNQRLYGKKDSSLIVELTNKINQEYQEGLDDESPWKKMSPFNEEESDIIYSKDSLIKVVNVKGVYPGAMTYSPVFSKYVVLGETVIPLKLSGKVFRVDSNSENQFIFYIDNGKVELYNVLILNNMLEISKMKKGVGYLFNLIRNKKEAPDSLPKVPINIDELSKTAMLKLGIDPNKVSANERFLLDEKPFLSTSIQYPHFQSYYHSIYGNYLAKVLRIIKKDSTGEIVLSSVVSNGLDGETISTEFVNDSIFVSTEILKKTLRDDTELMEYEYDSIVSKYKYDSVFDFNLISKDTFNYHIEKITKPKVSFKRLKIYSKPFMFIDKDCSWVYVFMNSNPSLKYNCYKLSIIDNQTGKIILDGSSLDVEMCDYLKNIHLSRATVPELIDVNFDGFGDMMLPNNVKSGSAGSYTDSYIYNDELEVFKYSELYSGYNLVVNKDDKILSQSSKGGGGLYFEQQILFDNSGNIRHIKKFRTDSDYSVDNQKYPIYIYEKIVDGKVIEKVTDTISDNNIGFWKWMSNFKD